MADNRILSCCMSKVTGIERPCGKSYMVTWTIRTDGAFETNKLLEIGQLWPDCLPAIYDPYPGYIGEPGGTIPSDPDPNSVLAELSLAKPTSRKEQNTYMVQGRFDPLALVGNKPNDQLQCDPLLWCPTIGIRDIRRTMYDEPMIFKGLFEWPNNHDTGTCAVTPECYDGTLEKMQPKVVNSAGTEVGAAIFELEIGNCYIPRNTAGVALRDTTREHHDKIITWRMWYPLQTIQPWKAVTAYNEDDLVYSDGNTYQASETNTSGNSAPTGEIPFFDGNMTWDYIPNDRLMWGNHNYRKYQGCTNIDHYTINLSCVGGEVWHFEPYQGIVTWDWDIIALKCDCQLLRRQQVEFTLKWAECGHRHNIANRGFHRLVAPGSSDGQGGELPAGPITDVPGFAGNATTPILSNDGSGNTVSEPQNLDRNGQPIIAQDDPKAIFLRWEPHDEYDWNDFMPPPL